MNEYAVTTCYPKEHATPVHPPAGDGWEILQMTQGLSTAGIHGAPVVTLLWVRHAGT